MTSKLLTETYIYSLLNVVMITVCWHV